MLTARFPRHFSAHSPFASAVDQLFGSVLADGPAASRGVRVFPALNAWEDGDNVFIEAELPGFRIEDLNISITGNELTLSGKRESSKPEGAACLRCERPSGSFSRTIRISADVAADRVSASLTNGVLTLTLPKAEAAKPRKIEVKATN